MRRPRASATSDAGDYIGQGQQYSYSTAANDVFNSSSGNGSDAHVALTAPNGDWLAVPGPSSG